MGASAFHALICSNGSQLLYTVGDNPNSPIYPNLNYDSHIDYSWGAEGPNYDMLIIAGHKRFKKKHEKIERDSKISFPSGRC